MLIKIFIFIVTYLPILILMGIIPYLTRKTECFGYTIPMEAHKSNKLKMLKSSYRNKVFIFGGILFIVFIAAIVFITSEFIYSIIYIIGILLGLALGVVFYLEGRKKVAILKQSEEFSLSDKSQKIIIDTGFRNKKILVSPLWFLTYIFVIVATVIYMFVAFDKIPEKLPLQIDLDGNVTNYMSKENAMVFFPCMQIFLSIMFIFLYWMIGKSKQQLDPARAKISIEQNRIFRYVWSVYILVTGLLINSLFSIFQFYAINEKMNSKSLLVVNVVLLVLVLFSAIVLSIYTGQGGNRIRIKGVDSEEVRKIMKDTTIIRDSDDHWKLGVFYYNHDDPALFVEKRFGVGWTLNFANKIAISIFVGIIVLSIIISIVSVNLK
ncbi:MAG: DUF5808 domain-containing protein [Clostridiales bacterium]